MFETDGNFKKKSVCSVVSSYDSSTEIGVVSHIVPSFSFPMKKKRFIALSFP